MKTNPQIQFQALNSTFRRLKTNREAVDRFKTQFLLLLDSVNDKETEEFHKNLVIEFLKETYYNLKDKPKHFINTKGRNDLVIHNGETAKTSVGVIIEAKKPANTAEMPTLDNLNVKAFHELILYYLRERITHKNLEIRHLIITNVYDWFVFDVQEIERVFAQNKNFVKQFQDFEEGRLADSRTDFFYKQIAEPFVANLPEELTFTYCNLKQFEGFARGNSVDNDKKLLDLYKLFTPEHLLKLPFVNDSNTLDRGFYNELLHIMGLTEVKDGGKKLIQRKQEKDRDAGSILEETIAHLQGLGKMGRLPNPTAYGITYQEQLFAVALELSITWINRILFLKLLEAQLLSYHRGDKTYGFLTADNFANLDVLFFQILARKPHERSAELQSRFANVPYLNSSLFEVSELEHLTLVIGNLSTDIELPILPQTVLKDYKGNRKTGKLKTLDYLFAFLDAYDFGTEGNGEIQEDNKPLITASVLGLVFEKINGYKDGSFFTPGFITMYMCRETVRKAVIQKFNEVKQWNCKSIEELYENIKDRKEASNIVNSIKICDPAVGSGHFLVSVLNELIAIKNELGILLDKNGKSLIRYNITVVNDELRIADENDELFVYSPLSPESRRIQETLFREKQTIIENCLFGVDINPNSVKICRLRLWIELLKNAYYTEESGYKHLETLPNIDINIKVGNSLISKLNTNDAYNQFSTAQRQKIKQILPDYKKQVSLYKGVSNKETKMQIVNQLKKYKHFFDTLFNPKDIDYQNYKALENKWITEQLSLHQTEEVLQKLYDDFEAAKEKWEAKMQIYNNSFEWRFEFPEVLDEEGNFVGFDVVVGNPPYIQLSKVANLPNEYKEYLLKVYETSGGRLNTFIFFIHLGKKLLIEKGILHFIVPNTILSQEYYTYTREFLLNKANLLSVTQCPILPFSEAVVETVMLEYQNSTHQSLEIELKELSEKEVLNLQSINKNQIRKNEKYSLIYDFDIIVEKVFAKSHTLFGELCEINQGIALKGDKSLSLKDSKVHEECYKLLDGRNINRYSIQWNGVYLDYDLDRIHSTKRKDIFETSEKLLFRRVSASLIFTYDDAQYYALNTLVVVNKINPELNLKFILGLMNSKLMNYVYSNRFKSTKTVFSEIQARTVKELPIPIVNDNLENKITELVNEIISLKKLGKITKPLETEIDNLVYQLYDLTAEEIKIVEQG